MIEFNPDGSIKMPDRIVKQREENDAAFSSQRAVRITRTQESVVAPQRCKLVIEASAQLDNAHLIRPFFQGACDMFQHEADLSIEHKNLREYHVTIISGKYRCSWCKTFHQFLGKQLNATMIKKGNCSGW